jgi:hypothetical protein
MEAERASRFQSPNFACFSGRDAGVRKEKRGRVDEDAVPLRDDGSDARTAGGKRLFDDARPLVGRAARSHLFW